MTPNEQAEIIMNLKNAIRIIGGSDERQTYTSPFKQKEKSIPAAEEALEGIEAKLLIVVRDVTDYRLNTILSDINRKFKQRRILSVKQVNMINKCYQNVMDAKKESKDATSQRSK